MNIESISVSFVASVTLAALVGSFLNVVILRLPAAGQSIIWPGSHCPVCKSDLRWYENIPMISYLIQRGRCRHCRVAISRQYPMVELIMTILGAALFLQFFPAPIFVFYFIFTACLLVISFVDLQHQRIPDIITLPGIVLGFVSSFFNPLLSWQGSALGIIIGYIAFAVTARVYFGLRQQEGMGAGDMKLLAMIGAFLGWQALPFIIFYSAMLGIIVGVTALIKQKKGLRTRIPYGPFLAVASLLHLFFGFPQ